MYNVFVIGVGSHAVLLFGSGNIYHTIESLQTVPLDTKEIIISL